MRCFLLPKQKTEEEKEEEKQEEEKKEKIIVLSVPLFFKHSTQTISVHLSVPTIALDCSLQHHNSIHNILK